MSYIIHRTDQENAGDWWSKPSHYYPINEDAVIDIANVSAYRNLENKVIVLGGGGLIGKMHWDHNIKLLLEKNKVILWGAGVNYTGLAKKSSVGQLEHPYPNYLDKFYSVGVRDYGVGYDWVPCASCLHDEIFSVQDVQQTKDILILEHKKIKFKNIDPNYRKISMRTGYGNFKELLTQIKRHDTIITNSYHGAYWGTILGRKVIVKPWGTKFNYFKWKMPFLNQDNSNLEHCLDKAQKYPDAWEEAKHANQQFWIKNKLLVASAGM